MISYRNMWFTTTPYLYARRRGSDVSIEYDRRGPIAVVTIDRPNRRNAVDDATAEELGDAWDRFDEDDGVLVGVLAGSEGTFSAGADLEAMDLEDRPEGCSASPASASRSRRSRPSRATASPAAWRWRCGVTSAWPAGRRRSAASSGGSASRRSAAAPSDFHASSAWGESRS